MQDEDYSYLRKVLLDKSGLVLEEHKNYLIDTRLMPVAKLHQIEDVKKLVDKLRFNSDPELLRHVIEAMATNETLFFRDRLPFEVLREFILPELLQYRSAKKRIRIWSAACSTGQEPYSISMLLSEFPADLTGWEFEILGTDMARDVLEKARAGEYGSFEMNRGLADDLKQKYFEEKDARTWVIKDEIKKRCTFQELNLLHPLGKLGTMDVVFCRNVLIYFDLETKRRILENIASILAPDGFLMLGAAESVIGITNRFKRLEDMDTGVYQRT